MPDEHVCHSIPRGTQVWSFHVKDGSLIYAELYTFYAGMVSD